MCCDNKKKKSTSSTRFYSTFYDSLYWSSWCFLCVNVHQQSKSYYYSVYRTPYTKANIDEYHVERPTTLKLPHYWIPSNSLTEEPVNSTFIGK